MRSNCTFKKINGRDVEKNSPFELENSFKSEITYFANIYWPISCGAGACYLILIFGLQRWMQNREAFTLKVPLFLWNTTFAVFSICGFVRLVQQLGYILGREHGFYRSICVKEQMNSAHFFWGFLFGLSKLFELGDTVFIVLRKRPLKIVQWYHHLVTMMVAGYAGRFMEPVMTWFFVLNYGTDSILYTYFAAKSIGVPVPVLVAKILTTFQFVQMLVMLTLNILTTYLKVFGYECARETGSIIASYVMLGSFSILFGKLFYNSVVTRNSHYKRE